MKLPIDALLNEALAARAKAYAPYSHFAVGACILTREGKLHAGCNVENAAYPLGQCAEASAIGNMIVGGSRDIQAVLVVADTPTPILPCGGCLQKISEFGEGTIDIICCNLKGLQKNFKLHELLGQPFQRDAAG